MNVVDSSGWLEYFANGPNVDFFAPAIESTGELLVPSLSLFEVFKRILQQRNEAEALRVIALMRQARVVELSDTLAIWGRALVRGAEAAVGRQHHPAYRSRARRHTVDAGCALRDGGGGGLRAKDLTAAHPHPHTNCSSRITSNHTRVSKPIVTGSMSRAPG